VAEFTARRFLSESFVAGASFVVNTYYGAVWNHDWYRGFRTTLQYSYGQSSFQGISRTDTYQDLAARGSYGVTPSLRVGMELRRDSRDSDNGGITFKRNVILLTLETAI
jgi:hypothetical protein